MLTYQAQKESLSPSHSEKPWLLLLLVFAWLWPGVFSHDLWNPTEPKFYATVDYMNQYGQWALPQLTGKWQLAVSPLYVWTGVLFKNAFSPWLTDSFSAVRMVSVMFMAIGLLAAGVTGRELLGRYQGRSVVLILIGSLGLVMPAHRMDSIPLVFAAMSLLLCALVLVREKRAMALLLLSCAYVLAFYSGYFLLLSMALLISLILLLQKPWRNKNTAIVVLLAVLLALPLCLLWPYALYKTDAAAFNEWWWHYALVDFGGIGHANVGFSLAYYLQNTLWYALPAWPLAIWTWFKRDKTPSVMWSLCLTVLAVVMLTLALMPIRYTENTILVLLPLTILGAAKLDDLRRGAAAFLNWFGIMTFGLLAIFIWFGFAAMNLGWPTKLAQRAAYFSPYYQVDWDVFPIIVAVCFSPLWLWAVTRKRIKGRQAITNWAAGVTLVWSLLMTLFLPWLDAAKSYRPVVEQMQKSLPEGVVEELATGKSCLSVNTNDSNIVIPWQTYGHLPLNLDETKSCQYRLVVGLDTMDTWRSKGNWQLLWQGARAREKKEWFAVFKETSKPAL